MSQPIVQRPGIAYRRPDGDPDRLEIDAGEEPRLNVETVPRTDWLEAVAPSDRDRLRTALADDAVDVTYRVTAGDEPTWVHERGSHTDDGDVVGYLFPAEDRAERRRHLEKRQERLEEFASVVSHDLRNPLSVAVGNIELAQEFEGEAADERLDRAHDALDWMDDLISDLLALAKEGRTVEETATVDLRTVVDRAWQTVGAETDAALVVDEWLPKVVADRSRLRQALENLFRNAIEHGTPEHHATDWMPDVADGADEAHGGDGADEAHGADGADEAHGADRADEADGADHRDDITPGTFTSGNEGQSEDRTVSADEAPLRVFVGTLPNGFFVADDGTGIDPSDRDSVFEAGHTTADEGTGFGLAIVERIADAHGWEVSVAESRDGGARFEFENVELVDRDAAAGVTGPGFDDHVATDPPGSGGSQTE